MEEGARIDQVEGYRLC